MDIYLDFLKYDPAFQNDIFSLFLQLATLIVAILALNQINLMKKQNKYSVDKNKIDALDNFQKLISELDEFRADINKIEKLPRLESSNYTLKELNKETALIYKKWIDLLSKNEELSRRSYDLANRLELFSVSIEDKEIFDSVKNMVAQTFCEMVENNPAVYISSRLDSGKLVHSRYQTTIKLYKLFLAEVGSIKEREKLVKNYIEESIRNLK